MLVLAALALAVSQDGAMDIPPARPIPTELAATFARAIAKNPTFAKAKGRAVQPSMQGILTPGSPSPSWVAEFQWKENGKQRSGLAVLVDVSADKTPPEMVKMMLAIREGPWIAAQVLDDQTFAGWAEQMAAQRRANNESMTVGAIRSVISGEAVFEAESGSYGELRCLGQPNSCLPGSKAPAMLDATRAPAEMHGYRRTFHPGAAVKGKSGQTGLIATWAYSAVPMDPKFGSRALCGDSTGAVCAVAGATMPPVGGGACPKSCQPLH